MGPGVKRRLGVLSVKKVAEDLFEAAATPPEVNVAWSTSEPVSARKLVKQLTDKGCHTIDIADALNEQDPMWIEKARGAYS
jgi:hypothetical protein